MNMADPCFLEGRMHPFNYTSFEADLKDILAGLGYPLEQVIRWERTGQSLDLRRAGSIEHFWENLPKTKQSPVWFASKGLYFDTNHDDNGINIYRNTQRFFHLKNIPFPKAIIAGTFELGTDFWLQRNVAARLIAVAIGASNARHPEKEFSQTLNQTCLGVGIDGRWCDLQGGTATIKKKFMADHIATWTQWKYGICDRLTEPEMKLLMKSISATKKTLQENAYEVFWENFAEEAERPEIVSILSSISPGRAHQLGEYSISKTGVIFDMVNSIAQPHSRVFDLAMKYLKPLGLKPLQLRLVDDFGFAVQLYTQSKLGYFANRYTYPDVKTKSNTTGNHLPIPKIKDFRELVLLLAKESEIQVIPEIGISTRSGGWIHSGFTAACPHVLCEKGQGVAADVSDPGFLPVVYSVLREIKDNFFSPFIHLGHDDREAASQGCLLEAGLQDPMSSIAVFEEKLSLVTEMLGIDQTNIARWNNEENKRYPDRTGKITHYQAGQKPQFKTGESFFTTVDLLKHANPWEVYKETVALVKLKPEGIFAELRALDENTWISKNVVLRLVAFTMGLQKDADSISSKEDFSRAVVDACQASELAGCAFKGDYTDASVSIEVEQARYQDKMCSEFTYNAMIRAPKRKHISKPRRSDI